MANVLKIENMSSGYQNNRVVNNVSFEVRKGEIFGLVGLNGAGKTTLIKTILKLRRKQAGQIVIEGNQQLAYLPEKFEPSYFLTGEKFIQFSLKLYGIKKSLADINVEAEKLSFNPDFLNKSVKKYSKGMRQKIGLLATIMAGCDLTILDEPMSGLDPKARLEIKEMILSVRDQGRSVFMSSHILNDVAELCDRVAIFHDQKIAFIGTPQDLMKIGRGGESAERAFLNIIEGKVAA